MTLNLDALEAIAKSATQVAWNTSGYLPDGDHTRWRCVGPSVLGIEQAEKDFNHIAAFNPTVALEMIAEIRQINLQKTALVLALADIRYMTHTKEHFGMCEDIHERCEKAFKDLK